MAVIEVDHLTKEYRLGQIQGVKEGITNLLARLRGQPVSERKRFKALDDIHFSVETGEVVGIIGHNGAGKSTLLKMLARVSVPTSGSVKVRGRVAPLIEVGAGLVPDMTGRENIFLNGAILGLSRVELEKKFDEIVAFSELEVFIDTPVKRYSSGMMVRLGFAIATSIDSEVLIVDEVLAVGDLAFQRKCFSRLEELIKRQGSTVLLVSHNIRQVERMCSRALILANGQVMADGNPTEICDLFYEQSNKKVQVTQAKVKSTGEVEVVSLDVLDGEGQPVDEITSGDKLHVRVRLKFNSFLEKPEIVIGTHTTDFIYLDSSSTASLVDRVDYDTGVHCFEYIIDSFQLVSGPYCIRVAVLDKYRGTIFYGETLKTITVVPQRFEALEPELRILNSPSRWIINGLRCERKIA